MKELERTARDAIKAWTTMNRSGYEYNDYNQHREHCQQHAKAMEALAAALPDPRDELCEAAVAYVDAPEGAAEIQKFYGRLVNAVEAYRKRETPKKHD